VKGSWYWDPPDRLRKSHNLRTKALGKNQEAAWAMARTLNRDNLQLGPDAPVVGTVKWLLEAFLASDRFKQLADKTQRDYRYIARSVLAPLEVASKTLGQYQARAIRARHADGVYAVLKADRGHALAHYACRLARRIWKWGGRRDLVDRADNPWTGMELRSIPQRQQRWTQEQIAAVCAKARELKRPSVALATSIAYWLAHRQGDVLTLTWSTLDAGELATKKTGTVVPIDAAAYPELQALIEAERERQKAPGAVASTHVVVCEMTQRPWVDFTFQHEFRAIARAAGIPDDLQFRDLRATAMTEIYDADVGDIPASTHTGHETASMRRRYARRTVEQFRNAAEQRVAHLKKRKD
jgi:hypothetical protein